MPIMAVAVTPLFSGGRENGRSEKLYEIVHKLVLHLRLQLFPPDSSPSQHQGLHLSNLLQLWINLRVYPGNKKKMPQKQG